MFRKGLVCGIIFLVIGLSITSSIGGYIGKTSIQPGIEAPTVFPLNNNYVDVYWKFDECSGDTLEDSSGHGYDGAIYESVWDTGQSGCALYFDGVDDYVDLDVHSGNIGFNKTDDVIFSLWFRSVSSDGGIMYCIAGEVHVPEARIELCPNGSLFFKVWTAVCGIPLYSDEDFNDGSWHQVEIFFNGITAKPTVEMYIDGEFESSITKWLCEIENDHYKYGKIGRRALENEGYFEGLLDEFKITKYPGGNDQNPPEISGPIGGYPGEEYEFTFLTEDPEGDEIWLFIDWGDGTFEDWFGPYASGQEVTVSHTYYAIGTFEIRAKSKDYWDDGRWSDPYPLKIGNLPPDVPIINGPTTGGVGTSYEFEVVSTDPDGDNVLYYMDWGDGTNSGWVGPNSSGETVTISHTWTSPGTYYIKAKAKDVYLDESDWSDLFGITIYVNNPPSTPTIDGPTGGSAGNSYDYTFTSTDPDGNKVSYYVEWGDTTNTGWFGPFASGTPQTKSHTWTEEGMYLIQAKAKDIYGAESGWGTLTVNMPRNKAIVNSLFQWFLERFPLLEILLNLR